jgi:FKBP-type peptidyl-prolyl cis-trans isomerase FkpA
MTYLKQLLVLTLFASILSCQTGGGTFKTKNGFEYTIHTKGKGAKAKESDIVFFTVKLSADTTVLQNNNDANNLPSMQLPKGWQKITPPNPFFEIFAQANVGDSLTLRIPVDSIPKGNPDLIGKKMINYEITVKDIKDSLSFVKYLDGKKAERAKKAELSTGRIPEIQKNLEGLLAQYKAKTLKLEKTASGLQYLITEKGTGPVAKKGQPVAVHYYGVLTDGKEFDNSFKTGDPIKFPVGTGNVIPGWDEALMLLPEGTKATIFIPSNLGYGDQPSGPIPAKSELVFYIEVLKP